MATDAWKGFIHSWHTLGQVLRWMCIVVVGIPFAVATCILVAAAVLLFAFLCLAAAFAACVLVFYFFKGLYIGINATARFIKGPKAHLQTLPTSSSSKHMWKKPSMVVPLQSWGASTKANQVSDSSEPPGYIYPWYEGNPDEPAQAHLGSHTDRQPPGPASSILSNIEDNPLEWRMSNNAVSSPHSGLHNLGHNGNNSAENLAEDFIPYCKVCHKAKPRTKFPHRKITNSCNHQPEICLTCLSESIKRDFDPELSTWSRICCPLCNIELQSADVRDFSSQQVAEQHDSAFSASSPDEPRKNLRVEGIHRFPQIEHSASKLEDLPATVPRATSEP